MGGKRVAAAAPTNADIAIELGPPIRNLSPSSFIFPGSTVKSSPDLLDIKDRGGEISNSRTFRRCQIVRCSLFRGDYYLQFQADFCFQQVICDKF